MSRSPNKHAFVDFTGRPYVYYQGVPYQQSCNCLYRNILNLNNEHPNRTIVRSIGTGCNRQIVDHVPVNGVGRLPMIESFRGLSGCALLDSNYLACPNGITWPSCARKDRMYRRYLRRDN